MRVSSATLAGGDTNQDRLFITSNAVILLDGASAFQQTDVDAGHFAETLGTHVAEQLERHPKLLIADAVSAGIRHAVQTLRLTADRSPSSTVSVLRHRPGAVDLYVLGDSPIHYGTHAAAHLLTDDRIHTVARAERGYYRDRLRAGSGFDDEHRAALARLQRVQRLECNRAGGYWIAGTCPSAATYAVTATVPAASLSWVVLATDGAATVFDHLNKSWPQIAKYPSQGLAWLLQELHSWESEADPSGQILPRAKIHDDKTVASLQASSLRA